MKKFLILILAFFAFLANGYGELNTKRFSVSPTTGSVAGQDTFITEIYYWNTATASYELEDAYQAHIKLEVPVTVVAQGKGYFSLWSEGDLHRYSSPYHHLDESPTHVSSLQSESVTRVKVGSGWPIIIFSGLKSKTVTAKGTLITDTPNKYEVKGRGKCGTSAGGGSASGGPLGGGTSAVSGSGGWVHETTSFRVSVLDVRPSPPSTPGSSTSGVSTPGDSMPPTGSTPSDDTPNCLDCSSDCSSPCSCSNSGTCGGTVVDATPNCSLCTAGCSACPTVCTHCNQTYDPGSIWDVDHHDTEHECVKCGTYYNICQNVGGACSVPDEGATDLDWQFGFYHNSRE